MYQKIKNVPSLLEFNKILDRISHDDSIGHLFIAEIKFHNKNLKTSLLNEIYSPIFEKNKKMEPYMRSTVQLISVVRRSKEKDIRNSFKYPSKTHSTLQGKIYIPPSAELLHFLIKRTGWLVNHVFEQFTFEQSKFKKDFVVINQKARQKSTSSVKRDFYKLLNNSNFGIDCRNNIENCILEPLYDELGKFSYIKKFCTIFGNETYREFFPPAVISKEIRQEYNSKLLSLNKNNPTYQARKEYLESKMEEDLDAVDCFKQSLKKGRKKRKFKI